MKICLAFITCALLSFTTICHSAPDSPAKSGHYLPQEIAFDLPDLITDPFDYLATDVQVQLRAGGQAFSVPAFFDGGTQWRARFTPLSPYLRWGDITLNGQKVETARKVSGVGLILPAVQKNPVWRRFRAPRSQRAQSLRVRQRRALFSAWS